MDVYENERDLFFEDKSNDVIQDDVFRRLSACHNVLFTGHQGIPDSRSSDQYFSDYAAKLKQSGKKVKPARTNWFNLAAPPAIRGS